MAEPLLIGCWGWDHAEWVADVFPEEMPADWRFCYYSNEHRSVVVPASTWARASADDVAGWVEDCDPEFSFVVELPAVLCRPGLGRSDLRQELARFLATLAPAVHLTRAVADRVRIPVIASGGAGSVEHFAQVLTAGGADAALAASLFHYGQLTVAQVKDYLGQRSIPVR